MILYSYAAASAIMATVMAFAWLVQRRLGNGGWTDVCWSFGVGLACCVLIAFQTAGPAPLWRAALCLAMALFWSLRLGAHLFRRTRSAVHEDRRYAQFRNEWSTDFQKRMFWFAQIQGPVGAALAVAVASASLGPDRPSLFDALAIALFAGSLIGEATADAQLRDFARAKAGESGVCDVGLWRVSRHPNYFFEWLLWVSWLIMKLPTALDDPAGFSACVFAAILMLWLLMKVSGVPPLERAMIASRGAAYEAYMSRTSAFFPMPARKAETKRQK